MSTALLREATACAASIRTRIGQIEAAANADNTRDRIFSATAALSQAAADLERVIRDAPTSEISDALRAYKQADLDGVMVLVSRQACEEGAAELDRLQSQWSAMRDEVRLCHQKIERQAAELQEVKAELEHLRNSDCVRFTAWRAP